MADDLTAPMPALVVMGVAGCGKSSVAAALCERSAARMIEGDAFHPPANIAKMAAGIALTDDDRQGWLESLGRALQQGSGHGDAVVLTCSALKRRYRDTLRAAVPGLGLVFLQLTPQQASQRVAGRAGHFMPASLIDSQFRDLEPPSAEARVLTVDATASIAHQVEQILRWWGDGAAARVAG